jgi:hypothetical protein
MSPTFVPPVRETASLLLAATNAGGHCVATAGQMMELACLKLVDLVGAYSNGAKVGNDGG